VSAEVITLAAAHALKLAGDDTEGSAQIGAGRRQDRDGGHRYQRCNQCILDGCDTRLFLNILVSGLRIVQSKSDSILGKLHKEG
jgi:hypothetical protein